MGRSFGASPDGLVYAPYSMKPAAVLEIKCKWSGRMPTWETGPDIGHVLQCQAEMIATGTSKCYLVYWTDKSGRDEMQVFILRKHEALCSTLLLDMVDFTECVVFRREPGRLKDGSARRKQYTKLCWECILNKPTK